MLTEAVAELERERARADALQARLDGTVPAAALPWRPISECPDDNTEVVSLSVVDGCIEMLSMPGKVAQRISRYRHWMLAGDFPLPGQSVAPNYAGVIESLKECEMFLRVIGLDHPKAALVAETACAMLSAAPQPPAAEGEV